MILVTEMLDVFDNYACYAGDGTHPPHSIKCTAPDRRVTKVDRAQREGLHYWGTLRTC